MTDLNFKELQLLTEALTYYYDNNVIDDSNPTDLEVKLKKLHRRR